MKWLMEKQQGTEFDIKNNFIKNISANPEKYDKF